MYRSNSNKYVLIFILGLLVHFVMPQNWRINTTVSKEVGYGFVAGLTVLAITTHRRW